MITENERRILGAISLCGELGVAKASKLCGLSTATVHRKLHRYIEEKKVIRSVQLNWAALGRMHINMFFNIPHRERNSTIELLKKHPQVVWFTENLYSSRYEITVSSREMYDFSKILDQICQHSRSNIVDPKWSFELSQILWMGKGLLPQKVKPSIIESYAQPFSHEVKQIDFDIFTAISKSFDSIPTIARKLKVPLPTVYARIAKLKSLKILHGIYYYPVWKAFNMVEFQITLTGCQRGTAMTKDLYNYCHKSSNIYGFLECVGSFDYKLIGVASSEDEAVNIVDSIKEVFSDRVSDVNLVRRKEVIMGKTVRLEDLK